MNLPPKALQGLVDLKAALLSGGTEAATAEVVQEEKSAEATPEPPKTEKREPKPYTTMRHARMRGESWQRYKRTGGW